MDHFSLPECRPSRMVLLRLEPRTGTHVVTEGTGQGGTRDANSRDLRVLRNMLRSFLKDASDCHIIACNQASLCANEQLCHVKPLRSLCSAYHGWFCCFSFVRAQTALGGPRLLLVHFYYIL